MVLGLLTLSSIGFGWFIHRNLLNGLVSLTRHQHNLRLTNIITPKKSGILSQLFLSEMDGIASALKRKWALYANYDLYLERLIERMNRKDIKPSSLLGWQCLGSFGAGLVLFLLCGSFFLAFLGFILGVALPILWARDEAFKREKLLMRELPNALEIISLCSEAGLSLEEAINQYLKNGRPGPLTEEFGMIIEQTRTGASRKSAFEAVSRRLDLTDFSLFTASLVHAERFGTGVAKTLRQLSITMRDKQTQRAEKSVQELPVKMLLPLIFFIMPVTFLIIFGPLVLQFLGR